MMKLSIIVPVYNLEKYIAKTLDSLLSIRFSYDYEIIVVNDGSTDGSGEIARRYAEKNSNFVLIDRENGGLSAARNTGLSRATGEYVYFLDSDDYLTEDALERLYTKASVERLDVLKFSSYTFVDPDGALCWSSENGYRYQGIYPGVYSGMEALGLFLDNRDYFPSCCLIFTRRDLIDAHNLRFYEGITYEDNLFHFQLMAAADRVAVMNEPLYCRRNRADSITSVPDYAKRHRSLCICIREIESYTETHRDALGDTGDRLVRYLLSVMGEYLAVMPAQMLEAPELESSSRELRRILKKYDYCGLPCLRAYCLGNNIYKIYRWSASTAKRLLRVKKYE